MLLFLRNGPQRYFKRMASLCFLIIFFLIPSYVIQPSSMYAKPSKHKFFIHRSHSVTDERLSTPPPSYQQMARQRAHSSVENCKNFGSDHPGSPATIIATTNSNMLRNPEAIESRVPKERTNPNKSPRAEAKHITDDSVSPQTTGCSTGFSPSLQDPNAGDPILALRKKQDLFNHSKGNSMGHNGGDVVKEDYVGLDFIPEAPEGRGKNEGQGEDIAMDHLPLAPEKGSPHAKNLVNMDNDGLLGVGANNRL